MITRYEFEEPVIENIEDKLEELLQSKELEFNELYDNYYK